MLRPGLYYVPEFIPPRRAARPLGPADSGHMRVLRPGLCYVPELVPPRPAGWQPFVAGSVRNLVVAATVVAAPTTSIPWDRGSFMDRQLQGFRWLVIDGCSSLASLPDDLSRLKNFQRLRVSGCSSLASLLGGLRPLRGLQ